MAGAAGSGVVRYVMPAGHKVNSVAATMCYRGSGFYLWLARVRVRGVLHASAPLAAAAGERVSRLYSVAAKKPYG